MPEIDDDDFDLPIDSDEETSVATQAAIQDFSAGSEGPDDFLEDMGIEQEGNTQEDSLAKPWMKFHDFYLITEVSKVRKLIDECIEHGHCALDLETQGFDNRIEYDENGKPYTRHNIVGYCIGLKGAGYYIPVRHKWEQLYDSRGPNVDDVLGTEEEIKRLCLASQPVVDPEAAKIDPLGSNQLIEPPKCVIKFWHAKFDQEFLYPICGIDWWHPDSFEDGMLAAYIIYTDGIHGLKDNAAGNPGAVGGLSITDPNHPDRTYVYEMIKFTDLFPRGAKKKDMRFELLQPKPKEESASGWNCVLYGCSDGICTDLLCDQLVPQATEKKFKGWYRLEKQVIQAVRIMERTRVLINKGETSALLEEAERELQHYAEKIIEFAKSSGYPNEFNPASSSQLADFLFSDGEGCLDIDPKPEKTAQDQYKTDEKTLDRYAELPDASPVFTWIIKHRQINKVKGTYLENLAKNTDEINQLRLNFKQTGAATGRFTAPKGDADHGFAGVPIQGIPAKNDPKKPQVAHSLRRMFVSRTREDGKRYVMAKVDYASQELRIAASVSGEEKWISEYVKELETGVPADLHFMTAQAFYPGLKKDDPDFKLKRGAGKTANFALVYGGGVGAVQRATGCDQVEGGRLLNAFHESVPKFSLWVKKQHEIVKKQLGVRTGFGRFVSIPDAYVTGDDIVERDEARKKGTDLEVISKKAAWRDAKRIRAACERKSTNYPIQGSGADILKISLILLIKEFHIRGWLKNGGDDSVRLVMTVHDEVVFEILEERVAEAIPILKKIMEYPSTLAKWTVPLIAEPELGDSWNAKLDWISMLKGDKDHPVPDYLVGQTIDPDPEIIVLSKKRTTPTTDGGEGGEGGGEPESEAPKPAPRVLQATTPQSTLKVETSTEAPVVEEPPVAKSPDPPPPAKSLKNFKRYAVFRLRSLFLKEEDVAGVYQALMWAKGEAWKMKKTKEMIPIELLDRDGNVLIPHKDGVLAYPEELERKLREYNLGYDSFDLHDVD